MPLLIFLARVCDVSLGTFRMILVNQGHKYLAAGLGFCEVMIWVLAVGGAIAHPLKPLAIVAYAGGFSCGVLVGMTIEQRIAMGYRVVRVISIRNNGNLCGALRNREWRVTRVDGSGRDGPVEIAFLVIKRRQVSELMQVLHEIAPDAFVTIERVERPTGANFRESTFSLRPGFRRSQMVK
ncbi:MAG: DUF2179 domain-containing protein [Phycisphaeraceae bacterium]|nr:DUF2179 domain-containing protein [Phycisphaeraceae bacterium]MCW5755126.1 DUF2179 domain-containing protein [Phycisphaeraceae bacterium]